MNWLRTGSARMLAMMLGAALLAGCAGALNLPQAHRPRHYTVHRGDTLYSIAWHYGLDYQTVARWNGIPPPYTIYPGQQINLYPDQTQTGERPSNRPRSAVAGNAANAQPQGASPASSAAPGHWQWPAKGTLRRTFGGQGIAGQGIVVQGKLGEAVRAASGGTVVYSGSALAGYGRLVIVKHSDEWLSAYAHNQRLLVHEGEEVKAGQRIATMGIGPDDKPELYFEIRHNGKPVNPLRFLPKAG